MSAAAPVEALVGAHLEAFNRHDRNALLAGLAPEVLWHTGTDVFRGHAELTELFDDGLWAMAPSLELLRLHTSADGAAAQLRERLTIDGVVHQFDIAVFFEITDGLIVRATVYREGSADID